MREEEDMKSICEKYEKLVEKQKKDMKCDSPSIFMSGSLFDKYISYYESNFNFNKIIIKNKKAFDMFISSKIISKNEEERKIEKLLICLSVVKQ